MDFSIFNISDVSEACSDGGTLFLSISSVFRFSGNCMQFPTSRLAWVIVSCKYLRVWFIDTKVGEAKLLALIDDRSKSLSGKPRKTPRM